MFSNHPTPMANKKNIISSVRASRDGHEFHEAWAARLALQLLLPTNNFVGIAVEGLSPIDQISAPSETIEIADLVLYFGKIATFEGASKVKFIQYKYSISNKDVNYRASYAWKTIAKFASAYLDHKRKYSAKKVRDKLVFELVTNQPIYPAFEQAITSIATGMPLHGEIKKQADQFVTASGLKGKPLIEFASKFQVTGLAQNLNESKYFLTRTIVDWSAADDAIARARLGEMRKMVRDKAGVTGTHRNVIERVDVLAALGIGDVDELFPCPPDLPEVGKILDRQQLAEAVELIPNLDKPLLIHAAGGIGKTVFLDSLAKSLSDKNEVLFFDCFGGGRYRAPEDSRHLPNRGLVHIANTLACRGLCDPLLPGNDSVDTLIRAFRRRLSQCVNTLSTGSIGRQLILFIDAIDNAVLHAKDRKEPSFPTLLLESFYHGGPIEGVKIIVSCRSHRIGLSLNNVPYYDFKLESFNITETETYLRDRLPNVTPTEIQVAQSRSGGNARILEHLIKSDRGLLDKSEISNIIILDDLLNNRIQDALSTTIARGFKKEDTDSFLAGLSIMPPPVPVDEYACALGIDSSAIESFAADLAPLLERTKYGLMFRDEPTETLIREKFGSDNSSLRLVAKNLLDRQEVSVYAARALPSLLQKLDDGKQLFELAFEERFPKSISSTVGKRKIRYARLKAAVLHAANIREYDRLVRLLVELSTIASVEKRGANYLLNNPDLVVATQDADATRRLYETRMTWPGTRHARLTIANTLSGDIDEAYRHAIPLNEWLVHYRKQDRTYQIRNHGPERLDIAAIPFCLLNQNRAKDALNYLRGWKDWYAFEVGEILFGLLRQAETIKPSSKCNIDEFIVHTSSEIGVITATLCFMEMDKKKSRHYIKSLANACSLTKKIDLNDGYGRETGYLLQEGLLKSSIMAQSTGLIPEALSISRLIPHERPNIWSLRDHLLNHNALQFLEYTALISALKGRELRAKDILPKELYAIGSNLKANLRTQDLREKLRERLNKIDRTLPGQSKKGEKESISYEEQHEAKEFLNDRLEPLLSLTNAFSQLLWATETTRDQKFLSLLDIWAEPRKKRDPYSDKKFNFFFQMLGSRFAIFALWGFPDLRVGTVRTFLKRLHEQEILGISTSIEVVAILSKTNRLQVLAGEEAIKTMALIESENDVTSRASYYAQLARAILPASSEEASEYFKVGLEQLDAIGSGDYQFTNELLLFAASIKGHKLTDPDFHTLTNICELNIPDDSEKFAWYDFAKALSRTSGCKALAKLARWDDRSKVSLEYTLLPYLTALIDDNKIAPEDALALNQLADPAELYECDTSTFANAIEEKKFPNTVDLISEIIWQYEKNNPLLLYTKILSALKSVAERTLGKTSNMTLYLSAVQEKSTKINSELDARMNYQNNLNPRLPVNGSKAKITKHAGIDELVKNTNPLDERSVKEAILKFYEIENFYTLKGEFFNGLRSKIKYSDRTSYIKIIGLMEDIDYFTKVEELQECKSKWGKSSSSLATTYHKLGIPIVQHHSEDFISLDYFSENRINELSALTDIPVSILSLELIKKFSAFDSSTPASAWLGLASLICEKAKQGEAQAALRRLLNSPTAKLSSSVVDGEWREGLYPNDDQTDIAAGLVWRMLGSPKASERWRAAHSMRCFAKFERWKVINALISKFPTENAHPFQAPELPFYYMHARLWLLIGLARIALDEPRAVARYKEMLLRITLDTSSQHILMRHFSSQALLICLNKGSIRLPSKLQNQIRDINKSPFPRTRVKEQDGYRSINQESPKKPESKAQFYLDYDFEKYTVEELTKIFGKPRWEIEDLFTKIVRRFDPNIKSMYENKGREGTRYEKYGGMSSKYHTYGQQLGWHASFLVAGELLSTNPVTDISFHKDPWAYYLNDWLLTRNDGLWLADGIDQIPHDVFVNLLEKAEKELAITGEENKIKELLGINSSLLDKIVVQGNWHSPDDIEVHVSSVMVASQKAKLLATQLIEDEPHFVWLPYYNEYGEEYFPRTDKEYYSPWTVCPAVEGRLDEDDPLGFISAVHRPYPAKNILQTVSLKTDDPFLRFWKNSSGEKVAFSDSWGYKGGQERGEIFLGTRFICTCQLLKEILNSYDSNLLILIKLQRYEKGIRNKECKFSNTVAVVQVRKNLSFHYYKGAVNKIHESKFNFSRK